MSNSLYSGVSGLALGVGLYRGVSGLWGGASGLDAGFAGTSPYSGSSLYLNFLTMTAPTFDSRITFSRGTNATLTDSTGRITYAPNNLVLRSQEFDNAAWTNVSTGTVTVVANADTAPDGTLTADRLTASATNTPQLGQAVTVSAVAHVFSVWLRADTPTTVQLLDGGTILGSASVTSTWQRFSAVFTPPAGTRQPGLRLLNNAVVFAWGAQLEQVTYQTTPSTYVATTSAAYYGPRFDYDPVTLAPRGLLVEEARTNLLTYSEQFDNAAWTNASPTETVTVAVNNTTAPDGTSSADRLTAAVGGTNAMARQIMTLVANTTYTGSIFVKASTATQSRMLLRDTTAGTNFADATITWTAGVPSIAGGATGTWAVTSVGNGWYRVTGAGSTGGTASPAVTFSLFPDTAAGTNAIFAWGAQIETGGFATSYIPTVASTVTRNADSASMTGTNFSSWYNQSEGTFAVDADSAQAGVFNLVFDAQDGTNQERITQSLGSQTTFTVIDGNVSQASLNSGATSANAVAKVASAYRVNDFASSRNGATAVTDTSGTIPTLDRMFLGSRLNVGEHLNGHIRQIVYYNTRLSNSQLQTLTAPSLAPTLSLDFTAGNYNVGF